MLQVIERHEYGTGVVLAHFRLGVADDHETIVDRQQLGPADGRQSDLVAGEEEEAVLVDHCAVGEVFLVTKACDGVADDRAADRFGRAGPLFRRWRGVRIEVLDSGRRRERHLPHLVAGQGLGPRLETRWDRVAPLVLQELLEAAHRRPALWIDTDQLHLLGYDGVTDRAWDGELHEGEDLDRRRYRLHVLADIRLADAAHLAFGVGKPLHLDRLDDDVGQHAVQPVAEFGAEPGHDAVDDDQGRHAEHDADDAHQRQVAGQQVTPAEEEFVHPVHPSAVSGEW